MFVTLPAATPSTKGETSAIRRRLQHPGGPGPL